MLLRIIIKTKYPFGFKLIWRLRFVFCVFLSLFFFFLVQPAIVDKLIVNSAPVHCSQVPQITLSATFLLKIGLTVLFTHLKIISLQCFQFQFSVKKKIISIQTHPILRFLGIPHTHFLKRFELVFLYNTEILKYTLYPLYKEIEIRYSQSYCSMQLHFNDKPW